MKYIIHWEQIKEALTSFPTSIKPRKSRTSEELRFVERSLTQEEKMKLGVADYYSPYYVSEQSRLKHGTRFWIVKRTFDIICATISLFILSPLILAFLLAIYIEDPKGSPIFVQQRVGRGGKEFKFYKMRSMCVDAEKKLNELLKNNEAGGGAEGKAFKMKRDPRITKVGRIIRSSSIDELLQLINIIKGDMSIVGPRPPLPREVVLYDDYERQRLIVTPGLTCFWQVYPKRHEISFEDWVALDIKYIQERSWWLDIKIICKTVALLFKGAHD